VTKWTMTTSTDVRRGVEADPSTIHLQLYLSHHQMLQPNTEEHRRMGPPWFEEASFHSHGIFQCSNTQ
jgi:hypothetical protein